MIGPNLVWLARRNAHAIESLSENLRAGGTPTPQRRLSDRLLVANLNLVRDVDHARHPSAPFDGRLPFVKRAHAAR